MNLMMNVIMSYFALLKKIQIILIQMIYIDGELVILGFILEIYLLSQKCLYDTQLKGYENFCTL